MGWCSPSYIDKVLEILFVRSFEWFKSMLSIVFTLLSRDFASLFNLIKNSVRFVSFSSKLYLVLTDSSMPEKKPFERLPVNVVPKNYALVLTPNLKDFTFAGEEEVEIEVKRCRRFLLLYTLH